MNQDTNNFNQQGYSQMSNHQNQDMEQNINVNHLDIPEICKQEIKTFLS